jgi:hypothetical protein
VTASPVYALTENDQLIDDYYDVGTDILGASDSILGGCDTYTWNYTRGVGSTVTDSGVATAFYISDTFSDGVTQDATGSSTLTTNGHVYATDTFSYGEDTGATATASLSYASGGARRSISARHSTATPTPTPARSRLRIRPPPRSTAST